MMFLETLHQQTIEFWERNFGDNTVLFNNFIEFGWCISNYFDVGMLIFAMVKDGVCGAQAEPQNMQIRTLNKMWTWQLTEFRNVLDQSWVSLVFIDDEKS